MKAYVGPILVLAVVVGGAFAPGFFRIVLYVVAFALFCGLCMELKSGYEAKARLRRYEP